MTTFENFMWLIFSTDPKLVYKMKEKNLCNFTVVWCWIDNVYGNDEMGTTFSTEICFVSKPKRDFEFQSLKAEAKEKNILTCFCYRLLNFILAVFMPFIVFAAANVKKVWIDSSALMGECYPKNCLFSPSKSLMNLVERARNKMLWMQPIPVVNYKFHNYYLNDSCRCACLPLPCFWMRDHKFSFQ